MRQKICIGNWKMNKDLTEVNDFLTEFTPVYDAINERSSAVSIGLAVPSVYLEQVAKSGIPTWAQNLHHANDGAFTGEISAPMIASVGAVGSLVGHSERRQMSPAELLGPKCESLLRHKMSAVFCVGETLEQRNSGEWKQTLLNQIFQIAHTLSLENILSSRHFILAYEPVWAIGTGLAATPAMAQEAHGYIREVIASVLGSRDDLAAEFKIIYGGSVKADNVTEFIRCTDIDGVLVGGASLNAKSFAMLCHAVAAC